MYYTYKEEKYNIDVDRIYIELTSACNASCPYCYNRAGEKSERIETEFLIDFVKKTMKESTRMVHLSGGEPLLHPDYMLFVNTLNQLGKEVLTVSNAFEITEKFLEEYMRNGNVLQLTLDSMRKEEHDKTRGNGNFDKVISVVKFCEKNGFTDSIVLRYNVIKSNQNNMTEFLEFARINGVKNVIISVLRNMGRAKKNPDLVFDYKNDVDKIIALNNEMAQLRQIYSDNFGMHISTNMFERQMGCQFNSPQDLHMKPRIDCMGNVYICEAFDGEENIVGNIYESDLESIFLSKRFEHYMST